MIGRGDPQARRPRVREASSTSSAGGSRRRRSRRSIQDFYICSLSLPLDHLQGPVPRRAAVGLLSRPARRALRLARRDLPPALFDQHLPAMVAGAAVPLPRAQRRDQHDPRQHELDEEPRDADGDAALRRAHRGHQAGDPGRRVGHRGARRRVRGCWCRAGRDAPMAKADADPRGVGPNADDAAGASRHVQLSATR